MRDGKVVGILQARMSSTRLPGKVLLPIMGRPMLARQLERLQRSKSLHQLVVATSDGSSDEPIAEVCVTENVPCFRGSLNDVLDRFTRCAHSFGASHIVRLTGDCPLTDPELIDELVAFYLSRNVSYASNCRPTSLPDGLDAEIFTIEALEAAWREADEPFAREHVVPFIVRQPDRFSIANWTTEEDFSSLRWTVDEPEDFDFVTKVYEALYPRNPRFGFKDVLALMQQQPELVSMNNRFERNQGSR